MRRRSSVYHHQLRCEPLTSHVFFELEVTTPNSSHSDVEEGGQVFVEISPDLISWFPVDLYSYAGSIVLHERRGYVSNNYEIILLQQFPHNLTPSCPPSASPNF